MLPDDRVSSSSPPSSPEDHPTRRIGPFEITRDENELSLRLENGGELGMHGCFLLFLGMFCIMIIGVMSVLQASQNAPRYQSIDASRFFSPTQNSLGFVWLVSSILMLIAVPVYVALTYRSALVFRFDKRQNAFFRGKARICPLKRIESLTLQEDKDPDLRYLYLLGIVYNDGQEMLLYNGYDERETMNLANELSSFLEVKTVWLAAPDRK